MQLNRSTNRFLCLVALLLPVSPALAQGLQTGSGLLDLPGIQSSQPEATLTPLFSIQREQSDGNLADFSRSDSLNINLGLEITPISGVSVRADAWRLDVDETPGKLLGGDTPVWDGFTGPRLDTSRFNEFGPDQPFALSGVQSNGIDLGASYVFETNKAGQFTLSTKATYVYDFRQAATVQEASPLAVTDRPANADLQSALTLTWDFGNHSASATTNYFDSFKDLSELNIEEINRLVDDIVTFDLQYGYSIKTGKQERAVFSFGIRNIFDKKTTQILNSNSRVVDQNGRVAYGSIKYQF